MGEAKSSSSVFAIKRQIRSFLKTDSFSKREGSSIGTSGKWEPHWSKL